MDAQTEHIYANKILVVVPNGFADLARRRAELNQMSEEDPQLLAALWDQVADEFEEMDYLTNAASCRRRANHYGKMCA